MCRYRVAEVEWVQDINLGAEDRAEVSLLLFRKYFIIAFFLNL